MPFEDSQGSAQTNPFAVQGAVAPLAANAAATSGASDYVFGWQNSNSVQVSVNHVYIENNTNANVQWELDAATSNGSPILKPGDSKQFDIRVTNLHLLTGAAQNVNGSAAGNIVVRGWL